LLPHRLPVQHDGERQPPSHPKRAALIAVQFEFVAQMLGRGHWLAG